MNAIFDDHDSSVQYIPSWRSRNLGHPLEFQSTLSNPGETGDAAQFTFVGSSVSVFGTYEPGDGTASMAFSIDNGPSTPFSTGSTDNTAHHQLFFTSQSSSVPLTDGPHVLSITSTSADNSNLFLDYLLVKTNELTGKQVFLDDGDPQTQSGVQFGGGWGVEKAESYFQGGVHAAEADGAWVSVTFEGTGLSLHGPYTLEADGAGPSASALIDFSPSSQAQPLVAPPSQTPGNTTLNNILYTTPPLPFGVHTVNITYHASPAPLFVDYFLVTGAVNGTQSALVAAQGPSALKPPQKLNVGGVIGGVIGAVLALLLLVAGLWLWNRRRRERMRSDAMLNNWTDKGMGMPYGRDSMPAMPPPAYPGAVGVSGAGFDGMRMAAGSSSGVVGGDLEKGLAIPGQGPAVSGEKGRYLYYPEG
uniref:Uncharacterized protein n=1 Tax=Mycena chlorophos TaxID=658473 RepID=A0ABQ0LST1_MYCCL|nr:predicted protein [Mycena chlorophos]